MKHIDKYTSYGRRQFLNSFTKLAGASLVLAAPGVNLAENLTSNNATFTVKKIIDRILKEIPGAPFAKTVDQLRSGNPEQEVTGIVTTMFPTLEVIDKTAGAGANFNMRIICYKLNL